MGFSMYPSPPLALHNPAFFMDFGSLGGAKLHLLAFAGSMILFLCFKSQPSIRISMLVAL